MFYLFNFRSQPVCGSKGPPSKPSETSGTKVRSRFTRSSLTKKSSPCQHTQLPNERKSSLRSAAKQSTTASEARACSHAVVTPTPVSKKYIKEPIARCIAGYMTNYINLDVNRVSSILDTGFINMAVFISLTR